MTELPEMAPLPEVKEQNLNARLAGLHSLNRNYRAYLNSQDPRMAAIRDYVTAYGRNSRRISTKPSRRATCRRSTPRIQR